MRYLCYLIPAAAAMAQFQAPPGAAQLLAQSGGPVLLADSVRLEGKESTEINVAGSKQSLSGTFSISRAPGGRTRIETEIGDSRILIVSDGTNTWTYNPLPNTYTKNVSPGGMSTDAFSRLNFARDPALFHDPKVEREEKLVFRDKPVTCYVVHAAYRTLPGNPLTHDVERTVWITQADNLVLRDVWEYSMNLPGTAAEARNRLTSEYKKIEWGISLPEETFVFRPPEGSRAVPIAPPLGAPSPYAGTQLGTPAVVVREVQPEYSAEARAAGLQGTISLYVEVDADGHPGKAQVMQGLGLGLDEKAIAAVRQWEFKPNHTHGDGLQDAREIDLQFRLDSPAPWRVASEAYWFQLPSHQYVGERDKPVPTEYTAPDPSACQTGGTSVIEFVVGPDGGPSDVHATRGDRGLEQAAVKAVRSWRFHPGLEEGQPVESRAQVELECLAGQPTESAPATPRYRVGNGVSAPVLTFKTEPEYSEEARLAKWQGNILLSLQISADGVATNMRIVRMLGMGLDEKAMEAVKRWRFIPGMKDGKPVAIEATIEVNFRLL